MAMYDDQDLGYTLPDRVAQARALGISYGQLMALIETGGKFPPQQRPIRWPENSMHKRETVVFRGAPEMYGMQLTTEPRENDILPQRNLNGCLNCGGPIDRSSCRSVIIGKREPYEREGRKNNFMIRHQMLGYLCPDCYPQFVSIWAKEDPADE